MALTPQEALGNKLEIEAEKIKELEKKCDAELSKRYDGRSAVYVDTNGYGAFVVGAVRQKFQGAGWRVKEHDNQRDGSSLSFEAKGDNQ